MGDHPENREQRPSESELFQEVVVPDGAKYTESGNPNVSEPFKIPETPKDYDLSAPKTEAKKTVLTPEQQREAINKALAGGLEPSEAEDLLG